MPFLYPNSLLYDLFSLSYLNCNETNLQFHVYHIFNMGIQAITRLQRDRHKSNTAQLRFKSPVRYRETGHQLMGLLLKVQTGCLSASALSEFVWWKESIAHAWRCSITCAWKFSPSFYLLVSCMRYMEWGSILSRRYWHTRNDTPYRLETRFALTVCSPFSPFEPPNHD